MAAGVLDHDDPAAVLQLARTRRAEADAAEADLLHAAVTWAAMHPAESIHDAAVLTDTFGETAVPVAGPGAPLIAEFAVAEFAAALGLPTEVGKSYLGHAVELHHRLPRTWRRVRSGHLQAWRARRVAEATLTLSAEAAAHVDHQVAAHAHRIRPAALRRLVDTALAKFDPATAEQARLDALDRRSFTIDTRTATFSGTAPVYGELDLADALDLEAAVTRVAEQLKSLGSVEALDARRAAALGELARGQSFLGLTGSREPVAQQPRTSITESPFPITRPVVLHLHLDGTGTEDSTGQVLTETQVREWCGSAGKLMIKPVIDLNQDTESPGYRPSAPVAEQVRLRDPHCVFPWCTRPATGCDLDHVVPFDAGGTTSTDNLAPLCRHHHRLKTHTTWHHEATRPGVYSWISPHGLHYTVDRVGTHRP